MSSWSSARHTDGREYWYNKDTNKTTWEKPEEIWTSADRLIYSQPWRALKTAEGKEYYHNKQTNETSWEMPEVFKQVKAMSDPPAAPMPVRAPQQSQNFVAGGAPHSNRYDRDDYERRGEPRRIEYGQSDTSRSSFLPAATTEKTYSTLQEAEAVFHALLKRVKVQADWTWEQTMRATITEPDFRAIADPRDRKASFDKFIADAREQDKEKEKERIAKLRQDFTTMLKSHPEIKYFTRWKTAREIIEGETIFRSTSDDTERRQLFEEYRASLQDAHSVDEAASRKLAREELNDILWSLGLEPYTRWANAQELLEANKQFKNDDKFRTLDKVDILKAYEAHVKLLERQNNAARKLEQSRKGRQARKSREEFRNLLKDLVKAGKLKVSTKWKELFPLIEDDPRFVAMCKTTGSSAIELYQDEIEVLDKMMKSMKDTVLNVVIANDIEITLDTTLEDLMPTLRMDDRTKDMSSEDLEEVFKRIHTRALEVAEEDRRQSEKQQRRAVDDLRHKIKYLEPPVRIGDSWERDVKPRVIDSKEYDAVETEELRRSAFDKVMQRFKEKEAEEKQRRERRERDREREREREGRLRKDSRTPEVDVYEADRRRAIADRERTYRRGSVTSGLSPPPASYSPGRRGIDSYYPDRDGDHDRERDRRDRYRPGSPRSYRGHSPTPYDRERRAREMERERAYMSRADPREGVAKELDYGDSRAGSMAESTGTGLRRPHRSSEEPDHKREIKRRKVDYRSKSPPEVDMKEEVAVRSGSEEGEIEEVTPEEVEKVKNGHVNEEKDAKHDGEKANGDGDAMEE